MKVSYAIDSDKLISIYRDLLKNSRCVAEGIQKTKFMFFWIVCFVILFPAGFISAGFGPCFALGFYVLVVLLLLISSKQLCLKILLWSYRKTLRKAENEMIEIELQDDFISSQNKEGLVQCNWKYVQDVERAEQFFLIKCFRNSTIIPQYAFNTQESFEEFCTQAETSFKEAEAANPKPPKRNTKGAHSVPILLGFLLVLLMNPGGNGDPIYVRETEMFWRGVFRSEMPAGYTFDTTDDFQKMISEEQWEKHIQIFKEKYGGIISMHSIAHVDLEADPRRAVVLHRVFGEKKSYYIRTYLVEGSIEWEINGYDIITPVTVDLEEQEFSLESDRKLLKEKLPYEIQITDNSVLELSGYQDD